MRKNRSNANTQYIEMPFGEFEELSDDDFFEQFEGRKNRRRNKRKRDARRQIERYQEDKELAGWISDYHYDSSE